MDRGVGHGRRGEYEGGRGPVPRAHPPEPAQHHREVGSEDAPIDVALVDDDVAQRPEERRPVLVTRQEGVVEQVGVGEDVVGVLTDPSPVLGRGVTVVGGGPQPRQGQPVEAVELVVGEGLGRREIERGRAPPVRRERTVHDVGEGGQQIAERLARGGTGREHDVRTRVGGLRRLQLVAPQARQPGLREGRVEGRRHPVGPRRGRGRPGRDPVHVGQPVLASTPREVAEQRLGGGAARLGWNGAGHRRYGTSA